MSVLFDKLLFGMFVTFDIFSPCCSSIHLSVCLGVCLGVCQLLNLLFSLHVCLFIHLFVYLFVFVCAFLFSVCLLSNLVSRLSRTTLVWRRGYLLRRMNGFDRVLLQSVTN